MPMSCTSLWQTIALDVNKGGYIARIIISNVKKQQFYDNLYNLLWLE